MYIACAADALTLCDLSVGVIVDLPRLVHRVAYLRWIDFPVVLPSPHAL